MGMPPTSPRFKFMYTHPVGASNNLAVPHRPPRQPPSPSTRSRSLELLDQQDHQERKSVSSAVVQRPPLPRPRSRSLDGLLDEDAKNGEEQDKVQREKSRECLPTSSGEIEVVPAPEESQKKPDSAAEAAGSEEEPRPVPRTKPKVPDEFKSETEDMRTSLDKDENDKGAPPTRPPKPSRRSSSEGQSSTCSSRQCTEQEHLTEEQRTRKTAQDRLMVTQGGNENDNYDDDDRSTMLKASRSCGAGLDSDGSVSSEYSGHKARAKGPGSLLSLPTGAEPKRKRNFMDKCVNKVRSFMKK